jgi:hypothetical protein
MKPPAGAPHVAPLPPPAGGSARRLPATPYAAALRRYLENVRHRDFGAALAAIDEAIALEPAFVEPRRCRAILWQLSGDYLRFAADWAACSAIDPHHREAEAIRTATQQLRAEYDHDAVLGDALPANACRHPRLRAVLEPRVAEIQRRRALLARPSCDLPCPSTCCYFEDETFTYGITLSSGELEDVRMHLRAEARDESDFIACVGHGEQDPVHYPRTVASPRRRPANGWRPRTCAYRELSWVTSRSRPCVFVGPAGCTIHDVGDPPGIAACRSFLCIAAFACLVLRDIGAVQPSDLAGRSMEDLQEFALSAVPLLAACHCSPAVKAARQDMRAAIAAAVARDASGGGTPVDEALDVYDAAHRRSVDAERDARHALDRVVSAFIERR